MSNRVKMTAVPAVLAVLFAIAEASVRISGITNVPMYDANNKIGYIPQPKQSGTMLWKYSYEFNELSMGVPERFIGSGTLLIGDSLVMGTNPYEQSQRLGPQLAIRTQEKVWPIAAISWALQNEIEYTREHPEVLNRVDRIALILNSDDFGLPSSWVSPISHPRHRHSSAVQFLFEKYVYRPDITVRADMKVTPTDWRQDLSYLTNSTHKPISIFLYPKKADYLADTNCSEFPKEIRNDPRAVCIAQDGRWRNAEYLDDIHPSTATTEILAEIISDYSK